MTEPELHLDTTFTIIRSCPFCGSEGAPHLYGPFSDRRPCFVGCVTCEARGPAAPLPNDAISRWNSRYNLTP